MSAFGRPPRTRAPTACVCCRARKVRCDVVRIGAPCSNCRDNRVKCIETDTKRRNGTEQPENNGAQKPAWMTRPHIMRRYSENWQVNEVIRIDQSKASPRLSRRGDGEFVNHLRDEIFGLSGDVQYATHEDISDSNIPAPKEIFSSVSQRPQEPLVATPIHLESLAHIVTPPRVVLPLYFKPFPKHISDEDAEYLQRKGALSIPEIDIRNALLQSYIEFVHGYVPLLNLHDFLQSIEYGDGEHGKVSLLVFQAVMFTATAFIDMKYLNALGFDSRKVAKKAFFQRAKLLYNFDYEDDSISVVQALLLMTYWFESPDEQKNNWYWMGVAITVARNIGLHCNPGELALSIEEQRLRKRLWWCCFTLDRLVALGMRRQARIEARDYDVPMLELSDLEIRSLPEEILCVSKDCRIARDVRKQLEIGVMFIQLVKLCFSLGHVLETSLYYVPAKDHRLEEYNGSTPITMLLSPRKDDLNKNNVQQCADELQTWYENLPEELSVYNPVQGARQGGETPRIVHLALLHMVYYTALSTLYRPQVFPSKNPDIQKVEAQQFARQKIRQAAQCVSLIAHSLHVLDLIRYLPTIGVTVMLPTTLILLLDMKSLDESIKQAAVTGFCRCIHVMQLLCDNYDGANFSLRVIDAARETMEITVPDKFNRYISPDVFQPRDVQSKFSTHSSIQHKAAALQKLDYFAFDAGDLIASEVRVQANKSLGEILPNPPSGLDQFPPASLWNNFPSGQGDSLLQDILDVNFSFDENINPGTSAMLDTDYNNFDSPAMCQLGGEGSGILTEIDCDWIKGYLNAG